MKEKPEQCVNSFFGPSRIFFPLQISALEKAFLNLIKKKKKGVSCIQCTALLFLRLTYFEINALPIHIQQSFKTADVDFTVRMYHH